MSKQNVANSLYWVRIYHILLFYKVAADNELMDTELLLLGELQG